MQLGIALKMSGDARRGEEAITQALNTPRQDERQWTADYGSALRDNALMLSLLEENNLRPDAQNALLSSLSEQAFGQRWLSTQENNALFLAAHSLQASAGPGRRRHRLRRSRYRATRRSPVIWMLTNWPPLR